MNLHGFCLLFYPGLQQIERGSPTLERTQPAFTQSTPPNVVVARNTLRDTPRVTFKKTFGYLLEPS